MTQQEVHVMQEPALKTPQPYTPNTYTLPIGPKVVAFMGLPYRILNMNPEKELLWGLWVNSQTLNFQIPKS